MIEELPLFAHRDQRVHEHSIKALHEEHPKLSARAQAILANVREYGPGTDRDLMHRLGFSDMGCVRPRITELIESHQLRESGSTICSTTKKRVRVISI